MGPHRADRTEPLQSRRTGQRTRHRQETGPDLKRSTTPSTPVKRPALSRNYGSTSSRPHRTASKSAYRTTDPASSRNRSRSEAVDNSLDACEEAGIIPELWVHIEPTAPNRFKVGVQDNGPGIVKKQVPI